MFNKKGFRLPRRAATAFTVELVRASPFSGLYSLQIHLDQHNVRTVHDRGLPHLLLAVS